jgi:hypothetical protein
MVLWWLVEAGYGVAEYWGGAARSPDAEELCLSGLTGVAGGLDWVVCKARE